MINPNPPKSSTTCSAIPLRLVLPLPQISLDRLNARHKEHPPPLVPPRQHADLLRIPCHTLKLGLASEVFQQEPRRGLHAVSLQLPQVDLVQHGGGEDGEDFSGLGGFRLLLLCVPSHLWVGVGGEVGDYLFGGDADFDGALDGLFGHFAGDEVGVAGAEVHEEGEEGDL